MRRLFNIKSIGEPRVRAPLLIRAPRRSIWNSIGESPQENRREIDEIERKKRLGIIDEIEADSRLRKIRLGIKNRY